jgi:hypothetical protein
VAAKPPGSACARLPAGHPAPDRINWQIRFIEGDLTPDEGLRLTAALAAPASELTDEQRTQTRPPGGAVPVGSGPRRAPLVADDGRLLAWRICHIMKSARADRPRKHAAPYSSIVDVLNVDRNYFFAILPSSALM